MKLVRFILPKFIAELPDSVEPMGVYTIVINSVEEIFDKAGGSVLELVDPEPIPWWKFWKKRIRKVYSDDEENE